MFVSACKENLVCLSVLVRRTWCVFQGWLPISRPAEVRLCQPSECVQYNCDTPSPYTKKKTNKQKRKQKTVTLLSLEREEMAGLQAQTK